MKMFTSASVLQITQKVIWLKRSDKVPCKWISSCSTEHRIFTQLFNPSHSCLSPNHRLDVSCFKSEYFY